MKDVEKEMLTTIFPVFENQSTFAVSTSSTSSSLTAACTIPSSRSHVSESTAIATTCFTSPAICTMPTNVRPSTTYATTVSASEMNTEIPNAVMSNPYDPVFGLYPPGPIATPTQMPYQPCPTWLQWVQSLNATPTTQGATQPATQSLNASAMTPHRTQPVPPSLNASPIYACSTQPATPPPAKVMKTVEENYGNKSPAILPNLDSSELEQSACSNCDLEITSTPLHSAIRTAISGEEHLADDDVVANQPNKASCPVENECENCKALSAKLKALEKENEQLKCEHFYYFFVS